MTDERLCPSIIEYRAFQGALFKRKLYIEVDNITLGSKKIYTKDITGVLIGRINKMAGNKIASSSYFFKVRDSKQIINVGFAKYALTTSKIDYDIVFQDIQQIAAILIAQLKNQKLETFKTTQRVDLDYNTITSQGLIIKPHFLQKEVLITWQQLSFQNRNGCLEINNNNKTVQTLNYVQHWNIHLLVELCHAIKP